jgi:hypothetical protein
MLEDLDSIDIVIQDPGKGVKFVIIDSGVTRAADEDKHLDLLNHKINCCLAYVEDDEKFEKLGHPDDITIEIRCAYAVKNKGTMHRSMTYDSGRVVNYKIVFVERSD